MRRISDSSTNAVGSQRRRHRGVTMVEMLVVVALVVLMMVILVQIFGAATGAVSASRTSTELDGTLRLADQVIRKDLQGATARMTPPNNPSLNTGYLEYSENSFADIQEDDTDDTLALTVKAPDGQPFTGRMFVQPINGGSAPNFVSYNSSIQPITVTSQYAEVIYFLRNGNLYRRVLLIAPERQAALSFGIGATSFPTFLGALTNLQGVNDFSMRPGRAGSTTPQIALNTLGDLTNRHNRSFHPRFNDDLNADGITDDLNGDGVPDYYPTLYPNAFNVGLVNEDASNPAPRSSSVVNDKFNVFAFPHLYQWSYTPNLSQQAPALGWIHPVTRDTFGNPNHAPLDQGDPLTPLDASTFNTWWGFPKWNETLSPAWLDPPAVPLTSTTHQSAGLQVFDPSVGPSTIQLTNNLLPPLNLQSLVVAGTLSADYAARKVVTSLPAFGSDNAGGSHFLMPSNADFINPAKQLDPNTFWEDDLLMTGVRSFDIKAYDELNVQLPGGLFRTIAGYYDLGHGSNPRAFDDDPSGTIQKLFSSTYAFPQSNAVNGMTFGFSANLNSFDLSNMLGSMCHEGRMPPRSADFRFNPQAPAFALGDDSSNVVRLRRVYDTWSTTYTQAPSSGQGNGMFGLIVGGAPVYPSYPAPYPAPLRGLQITVKVVDPRNQKVKTLTIRETFSDKL